MDFLLPYPPMRPSPPVKAKYKNKSSKLSLKDKQKSADSLKENKIQFLPSSNAHHIKTASVKPEENLFSSLISSDESDHEDKLLSDSTFFHGSQLCNPKAESTRLESANYPFIEETNRASFFSCRSRLTPPSSDPDEQGACEESIIYVSDEESLILPRFNRNPNIVIPESTESESTDEKGKLQQQNSKNKEETIILESSSEDDSLLIRKHFVGKKLLSNLNKLSMNKQDQQRNNIVIPTSSSSSASSDDIVESSFHGLVSVQKNIKTPSLSTSSNPPIKRNYLQYNGRKMIPETSEEENTEEESQEISPRTLAAEKLSQTKVNDIQRWINCNNGANFEISDLETKDGKSSASSTQSLQKHGEKKESSTDDSFDELIRCDRKPRKTPAKSSFIVDSSSSSSSNSSPSYSNYRKVLTNDIKRDVKAIQRTPFGIITGKQTPLVRRPHKLLQDLCSDSSSESESEVVSSSSSEWDAGFGTNKGCSRKPVKKAVDEKRVKPKSKQPKPVSPKADFNFLRPEEKPLDDRPKPVRKPVYDTTRPGKKLVKDSQRPSKKPVDELPRPGKKPVDDTPRPRKKPVDDTPRPGKKLVDDSPRSGKKLVDDSPRPGKKLVDDSPRPGKKLVDDSPRPGKKPVDDTPRPAKKPVQDIFRTPTVTPRTLSKQGKVDELKKTGTPYSPIRTFLTSLSGPPKDPNFRTHPEASIYYKNYKSKKEELARRLFKLYNREVFDSRLPDDMLIEWNARMVSTAGYCSCKLIRKPEGTTRTARIVLATKILDSADRLRDTLIHELCHAAVWLLNNISGGHGPFWKAWAQKAERRFPELPPIKRCHEYKIETKFTYRCTDCGYSFGRHSKSINLQTQRCGHCYGTFEVLVNKQGRNPNGSAVATPSTPKPPTGFALFVKENYGSVKKDHSDKKHGDIMKLLGQKFAEVKIGQGTR